MRKSIFLCAICLWAAVLLAGDKIVPLNVKTGLWQTTETVLMSGGLGLPPGAAAQLSPEQRAKLEAAMKSMGNGTPMTHTYKSCVTEKDLKENPFNDKSNGAMKCRAAVIKSTSSDAEVQEDCAEGTTKFQFHVSLHASSREHVTAIGKGSGTMGGHTMNSAIKLESKWLGASCPAGVN